MRKVSKLGHFRLNLTVESKFAESMVKICSFKMACRERPPKGYLQAKKLLLPLSPFGYPNCIQYYTQLHRERLSLQTELRNSTLSYQGPPSPRIASYHVLGHSTHTSRINLSWPLYREQKFTKQWSELKNLFLCLNIVNQKFENTCGNSLK